MSDEERTKSMGRILEDYLREKVRFVLLTSESRRYGEILQKLGRHLIDPQGEFQIEDGLNDKIATLLTDLQECGRKRDELRQSLVAMGVDLR